MLLTLPSYRIYFSTLITNNAAKVGPGGSVLVSSGFSQDGSSGTTSLESSPSGPNGVSGNILVKSGASEAGTSGKPKSYLCVIVFVVSFVGDLHSHLFCLYLNRCNFHTHWVLQKWCWRHVITVFRSRRWHV